MRGASLASRDAVLEEIDPILRAAGTDAALVGEQLLVAVDTLDGSGSLRRALTDPARPGADKSTLVDSLFGGFDSRTRQVLHAFAARRWGSADDLAEAVDHAATHAVLASAEAAGTLDAVEEDLFRIDRTLAAERELLVALDNPGASPDSRAQLARTVFASRVSPVALALVERAARAPRGRRIPSAVASFMAAAAQRRERSVAEVTAAVELTAEQRKRLSAALVSLYGREIHLNFAVDPRVIGGIRVQVGHQVVDGTIATRLDDARRRLVG